jgi:hypothetical protein
MMLRFLGGAVLVAAVVFLRCRSAAVSHSEKQSPARRR